MAADAGFKQPCPGCSTQITIKNPALIGKKVDCPKCKYRFVVEEPKAGAVNLQDTAPPAADSDAKTKPDKKPKKAKVKGKKGEKESPDKEDAGAPGFKEKKQGGRKWQLIIGGAALLVLVGGGCFYFFFMGGDDKSKKGPSPVVSGGGPKAPASPSSDQPGGPAPAAAPTPQTPAPPQPSPQAPTAAAADAGVAALVDQLADPMGQDKVKADLLQKMAAKKEDRDAGLKALQEKALAERGGNVAFAVLQDAAKHNSKELKEEAEKVLADVTKQRTSRAAVTMSIDPTNMLPNNTQVVLSIPVKKFMDSQVSSAVFRTRGAFRSADFQQRLGIPLEDIEQIVIGANKEHSQVLAIIRTFDDFDWEAVKQALRVQPESGTRIKEKDYYIGQVDFLTEFFESLLPIGSLRTKAAIHRKDGKTLVYGDVKTVEEFLASPPKFQEEAAPAPPDVAVPRTAGAPPAPGGAPAAPMNPAAATPTPPADSAAAGAGQKTGPSNPMGATGTQPGTPAATPTPSPAPPPTAKSFFTLKPYFRQLIERAAKDTQPLILLAEEFPRGTRTLPKNALTEAMPVVAQLPGVCSAAAVALNGEQPLTLTAALACHNKTLSQGLQNQLEKTLSDMAKKELRDALGFEFVVQGAEEEQTEEQRRQTQNPYGYGNLPGTRAPAGRRPSPGQRGGAPRPGTPGAFFPGQPGQANEPFQEEDEERSTIDIVRQDEFLTITMVIIDKTQPFVDSKVAPHVTYLRGQMEMNSGRLRLPDLSGAISRYPEENQRTFPRGTFDRPTNRSRGSRPWPPNERVSWLRDMLPYLGDDRQVELHQGIDPKKSWRDPDNVKIGRVLVSQFLHPQSGTYYTRVRGIDQQLAVTHFVGMAGIGPDAAQYAKDDKRAGIFGYDRATKWDDIKDGASNTILIIQSDPAVAGPWLAGGGATVRGTSTNADRDVGERGAFLSPPYGGKEGAWIIMADGSVRFLAKGVSPQVFKDLCTMAGGQAVAELHRVAPKADLGQAVRTSGTSGQRK